MTLLFAWRYFKAKKSTNAINIIAWISVLAIAVGAAALIIVLSVFNGFEDLVKSLYADFYADVRIAPANNSKYLVLDEHQLNAIRKTPGVRQISLVAEEKAVLVNDDLQSIVFLKGVDDAYSQVSGLPNHIIKGNYFTGSVDEPFLVLGAGVENAVGITAGLNLTPLTVYLPNRMASTLSSIEALTSYNINVSSSFIWQLS